MLIETETLVRAPSLALNLARLLDTTPEGLGDVTAALDSLHRTGGCLVGGAAQLSHGLTLPSAAYRLAHDLANGVSLHRTVRNAWAGPSMHSDPEFREGARLGEARYGDRTFRGSGDFRAVHVHLDEDFAELTACVERDGRLLVETRLVSLDKIPPSNEPFVSPRAGTVAAALAATGTAHLDVAWATSAWETSATPVVHRTGRSVGNFLERESPRLRGVVAARAESAGYPHPRSEFREAARSRAFRAFVHAVDDGFGTVLAALDDAVENEDVMEFGAVHRYLARRERPGRFAQAFSSTPMAFEFVRTAAVVLGHRQPQPHSHLPSLRRCGDAIDAVASKIDAGGSPRKACVDVFESAVGRSLSHAVSSSLVGSELQAAIAVSPSLVANVESVVGSGRHRALDAREVRSVIGYGSMASTWIWHPSEATADVVRQVALAMRDDTGRYLDHEEDFRDVATWFLRCLVRVGLARYDAGRAYLDIAYPAGRRKAGVDALSARWHADVAALTATEAAARATILGGLPDVGPCTHLYPTPPDFPVPEGMVAERLPDAGRFVAEGREMGHCVGSYCHLAERGDVVVYSVRDASGRSTACLNVVLVDGKAKLTVNQVRSSGNLAPPSAHAAWALSVAEGSVAAPGMDAFARSVAEARAHVALRDRDEASLPPETRDLLADAAFASLRPFLTRSGRRMGRKEWMDAFL